MGKKRIIIGSAIIVIVAAITIFVVSKDEITPESVNSAFLGEDTNPSTSTESSGSSISFEFGEIKTR
jgi:hypothetical protein